jgi:tetratricopeptide (TPR) repeat protein
MNLPGRACVNQGAGASNKQQMPRKISEKFCVILLFAAACATLCRGQAHVYRPAPPTAATIDSSEAMFATMCALYAAGYESNVNPDNWSTYRSQMRERLRAQKGPAVDALKEFYKGHQFRDPAEMLSRFVWFGLVSGPAPKFRPVLRRDELPPDVIDLEGFSEILSNYYTEQNIGKLYRDVQPLYDREIERLHEPVSQILFQAGNYLRAVVDPATPKTFTVIVEPLVGRITNVRNFVDHYAIILSGSDEIPADVVRHAYLHFLLDGVSFEYPHVITVKRPLFEIAARAPRLAPDLKDDFPSWFGECTVRAVEIKLKKMSPSEREAALENNDADGYVLVRPIFMSLAEYEKSEPAFRNYFPDLIRAIDVKTELTRVAAIKFAPAEETAEVKDVSGEIVAKKRVSTLPSDPEAIAALTEGEKQLSAKNPRAAEASFKSVLAKYPNQPRAWYGLAMVAVLDHDAERAKEVFGRLTAGQYAATRDPLVMAWSHIYLARIFEDEGQLDRAKSEYQAALNVQGAPERAQEAAQKGLGDLDLRKPSERP